MRSPMLPPLLLLLLLLLLVLVCSHALAVEEKEPKTETIKTWQYCLGCKETVQHYLHRTAQGLQDMQKKSRPSQSVLEANKLSFMMCEDKHFDQFKPFARLSCIKLLSEDPQAFLSEFAGSFTAASILEKAANFRRKRHICVKHFKACPAADFKSANVTKSERTKCNACHIVGNEIENVGRMLAKGKSVKGYLDDIDFCVSLGYSYQPVHWVEPVCDQMLEDHLGDIEDILRFSAQVAATGLGATESATDMMCREFFKCPSRSKTDDL